MRELTVCIGSSCHLKGSYNIIQVFQQMMEQNSLHDRLEMKATFCMKRCQEAVAVSFDGKDYSVSPETAKEFFNSTIVKQLVK